VGESVVEVRMLREISGDDGKIKGRWVYEWKSATVA
jgi:hypothetical protein